MRVLICDDALFMRNLLQDILTRNGHEIVGWSDNGYGSVKRYKEYHPDVVTMDITMPNMNGIEALVKIKEFDPDAHVIMCSALGMEHRVLEAIRAGADDFITKPFGEEQVIAAINKIAEKMKQHQNPDSEAAGSDGDCDSLANCN